MGGNALKNVETRRYQAEEYRELEKEILSQLREDFPKRRIETIQAYKSKPDFGDMDILFQSDMLMVNLREYINKTFNPKEIVPNGSVISFEYSQFQIDLICVPLSNFETSANYFAWNDLGNLMGRVAHKLGFKYGHRGLELVFRDGDYQYAEIIVSKNIPKIFEFLGYDYSRFQQGFETLEEVYEFASTSEFFNPEIYSFDNRNHASRVRDKKRATYNGFLTWLETAEGLNKYPWANMKELGGARYKDQFIDRASSFFPDFRAKFDKVQSDFELHKKMKANFNGGMVRELVKLDGRDLGEFMQYLRETRGMDQKGWEELVLSNNGENVKHWVLEKFEVFNSLK